MIRTSGLAELLDVASLLANQPLPEGGRVGILTSAGGPGDHVRRRLRGAGLRCPASARRRGAVCAGCRRISVPNPVDMIATATADQYRDTIPVLAASGEVDA